MSNKGRIFFGGYGVTPLNLTDNRRQLNRNARQMIERQHYIQKMKWWAEHFTMHDLKEKRQQHLNDVLKKNIILTENDYRLFHEVINDKTQFISGNSLFMAIHIKNIEKSIALNKNNLTNLNLDDITNIVIVFSCDNYNTELYYKFISEISKLFGNKNFIFIFMINYLL